MVYLARGLREGKIDKDKLVGSVMQECFEPKSDQESDQLKNRVLRYLEGLLYGAKEDDLPLVRLVSEYCQECDSLDEPCISHCPTEAIKVANGKKYIDHSLCVDCGYCVDSCIAGSLVIRSEFARVAAMLYQEMEHPVYAILAPSFVGQFGEGIHPAAIKAALKGLGFTDSLEVAMAADIITLYEAREFVERMHKGDKFMITSCCCPVFIKLVEKVRPKVSQLVSDSISPMIAMGKLLKKREPQCRVVFIGPCVAKKNEALLKDLQPAVDCVLTFKEASALIEATGLPLTGEFGQESMQDASHDGRAFAFIGGVSAAITRAVKDIDPTLVVRVVKGNGVKDCNRLLQDQSALSKRSVSH
jgi:iron only hydrogenase large subunit-like protein